MSTIPPVGSVPDVVTNTLIASDWGNAIGSASRGRVVQRFNSTAERDSAILTPVSGMLCYVVATNIFYGYRNPGGWTALIGGPRDTMHARVSRSAVWTVPTTQAVVPYDTVERDPQGLFNTGALAFTLPVAGIWLVQASGYAVPPASASVLNVAVYLDGTGKGTTNGQSSGGYAIQATAVNVLKVNAGQRVWVQMSAYPSAMSSTYADPTTTFCNLDYLGTG